MAYILRNNFTGGELSPEILMRPDLGVYHIGLKQCDNFLIKPQGGMVTRPGSEHCFTFENEEPSRLVPFVFSRDEAYVLAFSNTGFQVFRRGEPVRNQYGLIVGADFPYDTSLTEEELWDIDYAQSADVMTVTVPGRHPFKVKRYGSTDWRTQLATFETDTVPPQFLKSEAGREGPDSFRGILYMKYELQRSYTEGGETYYEYLRTESYIDSGTDTSYAFESVLNNGTEVFLNSDDPTVPASVLDGQVYVHDTFAIDYDEVTGGPPIEGFSVRVDYLPDNNPFSHQDPKTITLTAADGPEVGRQIIYRSWEVTASLGTITTVGAGGGPHEKTYRYRITAVYDGGEESVPSEEVVITCPALSTTFGVRLNWSHPKPKEVIYYRVYKCVTGPSGAYGWIGDCENQTFIDFNIAPIVSDTPPERTIAPNTASCVTYYQQRQLFGDLNDAPLTFAASKIAHPFLFRQSRPIQPDDAFTVTAATPHFNEIQYLVPLSSLLVLTTGAEMRTTEGASETFTASTTGIRRISTEGAAKVKPAVAGSTVIYTQISKQRLRSLEVTEGGGYLGTDVTLLARHLFEDKLLKQISFSREPHGVLWCLTEDGEIRTLTYLEGQKVTAWSQHHLAGQPGQEVNAQSVVTIPEDHEDVPYMLVQRGSEQTLERIKNLPDVYGLDSWTRSATNGPVTTFSGFDHLAGETVRAVADGYDIGEVTVNAFGKLETPFPATEVFAGYMYYSTADLPPIYSDSFPRDNPKGINRVVMYVHRTRGMMAGALSQENPGEEPEMWEAYPLSNDTAYRPPEKYSGPLEVSIGGPWSIDGILRMEHREPFRAEVLGVEIKVDV